VQARRLSERPRAKGFSPGFPEPVQLLLGSGDLRRRYRLYPGEGRCACDYPHCASLNIFHKDRHPFGTRQVVFEHRLEITKGALDHAHRLPTPERYRIQLKNGVRAPRANAIDYRLRNGNRLATRRGPSSAWGCSFANGRAAGRTASPKCASTSTSKPVGLGQLTVARAKSHTRLGLTTATAIPAPTAWATCGGAWRCLARIDRLVADQLSAAVGENRLAFNRACPVLLAAIGVESCDPKPIWRGVPRSSRLQ
jgi:hypothetical protein